MATDSIAPQHDLTWVANFDIELVPHRPKAAQQDISNRHFRVLYAAGDDTFMAKLADQFHQRKASVSFEAFAGALVARNIRFELRGLTLEGVDDLFRREHHLHPLIDLIGIAHHA